MAETQTPLQIFQDGEAELVDNAEAYRGAQEHQKAFEGELRSAERATADARRAANDFGGEVLNRIHHSVDSDTDPSEYLQAILNTYHSGERVGDRVAEQLAPLRSEVQSRSIPLAIVGSTHGQVRLGFNVGDMQVRRRKKHEEEFDTAAGVRLSFPMTRTNGYNASDFGYREYDWTYDDNASRPLVVGVKQSLGNLRIAGDEASIRRFNDMPHAPFNQYDTVMHHERDIKDQTGFVPVIVYGQAAVSGLLTAFYERRGVASYKDAPSQEAVLASAISLDLNPSEIVDVDEDELKERLNQQFLARITEGVVRAISNESGKRQFPNSHISFDTWPITASPQVMEYASVAPDEVVSAMQRGIERSIGIVGHLRADDPDDRPSWISDIEQEHRLLETEAQELALGMAAIRYGLVLDSAQLRSEVIDEKLATQLAKKRDEKAIHERLARENPWLYANR